MQMEESSMVHQLWEVGLLLRAWDDLDRAVEDVSDEDMLRQIDGGSAFAWTMAHVSNGIDSWLNRRFMGLERHPLIANSRFQLGGDGAADNWPEIRAAVAAVRIPAREFLLGCSAEDLERTVAYDGAYAQFREHGLNLRIAILQNAIHHTFHLGEIVAKRELLGYEPGIFPGSVLDALRLPR
jgi:hypothetical protein